ncbi:MAG: hypothetical protein MJ202_06525 [Lentisphaeria bacterium]|nr:hypothetical protein [Lentisphaeria bacterium]
MKVIKTFSFCAIAIFLFCSCASTTPELTHQVGNAYDTMEGLLFYTRGYLQKQKEISLPKGINEKHFTKLPLGAQPGFKQVTRGENSSDVIPMKMFDMLKTDFESMLSGIGRFPVAQILEGRADADLQQMNRVGIARVAERDVSEMTEIKTILNVSVSNSKTASYQNGYRTTNQQMEWNCVPMDAVSQAPVSWWPPTKITSNEQIVQKVSPTGQVVGGLRTDNDVEREAFWRNLSRKAQLKFIQWVYENFPAGGVITDMDLESNLATIAASRSTGLQNNMEVVVYAREKGRSIRVPLFSATATAANEGDSDLKIWRYSQAPRAQKIINQLRTNSLGEMEETYEFWGVVWGLAEPPDFIN